MGKEAIDRLIGPIYLYGARGRQGKSIGVYVVVGGI
jgi:hypothetical protein